VLCQWCMHAFLRPAGPHMLAASACPAGLRYAWPCSATKLGPAQPQSLALRCPAICRSGCFAICYPGCTATCYPGCFAICYPGCTATCYLAALPSATLAALPSATLAAGDPAPGPAGHPAAHRGQHRRAAPHHRAGPGGRPQHHFHPGHPERGSACKCSGGLPVGIVGTCLWVKWGPICE